MLNVLDFSSNMRPLKGLNQGNATDLCCEKIFFLQWDDYVWKGKNVYAEEAKKPVASCKAIMMWFALRLLQWRRTHLDKLGR